MKPDVGRGRSGEEMEFYGSGCAQQAWGTPLGELWEQLRELQPFMPQSGRVAAAMVEPMGDGLMRPILAELQRDADTGDVAHVANIMWGPCTRDSGTAAQHASKMHESWYQSESVMVVTADGSTYEEQKGIAWRVLVELAGGVERYVNDERRGSRQTKLGVDYDDSKPGTAPCFVLTHVDAHGHTEPFARLPLQDCYDIDGNPAGWATPRFIMVERLCDAAFEQWEALQEQHAESMAQSTASTIGSAVAASERLSSWLRFSNDTPNVGEVAAELGAEAIEYEGGGRSWLTDQRRSRLCHRPRVVVSEAEGDRRIKVETLNGDGVRNFAMTLEGTFDELGRCTGTAWATQRRQPAAEREPWTAEQLAAFDDEGHNHDIDDELGVGHVCGACELMSAPGDMPDAAAPGSGSLRLGGDPEWRPTIGDVAGQGLEL